MNIFSSFLAWGPPLAVLGLKSRSTTYPDPTLFGFVFFFFHSHLKPACPRLSPPRAHRSDPRVAFCSLNEGRFWGGVSSLQRMALHLWAKGRKQGRVCPQSYPHGLPRNWCARVLPPPSFSPPPSNPTWRPWYPALQDAVGTRVLLTLPQGHRVTRLWSL